MDEKSFHERAAQLYQQLADLHRQHASGLTGAATLSVGQKGRIKDLSNRIFMELASSPNLTTAELAERLYSDALGMDRGTFLRRVTVTVSAMHTNGILWSYEQPGSRALRWHLSDRSMLELQEQREEEKRSLT